VGGSFPLALAPSEILAAKLRSPRDQDAGLPGNVNEGEDNTDEERALQGGTRSTAPLKLTGFTLGLD
jgi:hypothetical protein